MIRYVKILFNKISMIAIYLFYATLVFAQSVPPYIHYQGRLTDQITQAPIYGKKSIIFSLYSTETGGAPIYSQTQEVNIMHGVFSAYLGKGEGYYDGNIPVQDGIPPEVFTEHSARYLGIRIADSESEMLPRQLIASVAYAYQAARSIDAEKAAYALKATEAENVMGRVTVDSASGNVGIGAPTPTERLDLGGGNVKMGWSRHSSSSEARDCYVNCPAGKVVVGGGCDNIDDTTPLIHTIPYDDDTWFCRWRYPNSNHCRAICANMR